jgi:cell fate regulator YaaT (PSP1 superfamily)
MPLVVGVRFNPATKVYYFDPSGLEDLTSGEAVVVETARGEEVGRVIIAPRQVTDAEIVSRLKTVHRRASALDLTQMAFYKHKERDALEHCKCKVREHDLPMKLVRAEYNYDGRHLIFFFTAEKRIDFRALVQDLARLFKARIELRQIGVRDEAKLLGGIGKCGLSLCCTTWLADFDPVSIKMAKQQDLPLSPMEISGVCGRLLCCLAYEAEHYAETKKRLPRRGDEIDTPRGRGRVIDVNPIKESVQVELENQVTFEVTYEELTTPPTTPAPQATASPQAATAPTGHRKRRRG